MLSSSESPLVKASAAEAPRVTGSSVSGIIVLERAIEAGMDMMDEVRRSRGGIPNATYWA